MAILIGRERKCFGAFENAEAMRKRYILTRSFAFFIQFFFQGNKLSISRNRIYGVIEDVDFQASRHYRLKLYEIDAFIS